jgi:hypothetical protein
MQVISCISAVNKYSVRFSFLHICVMFSYGIFFLTEYGPVTENVGDKIPGRHH